MNSRRALLGIGVLGFVVALDRLLAARRGTAAPAPIHSLVVVDAPPDAVWAAVGDVEGQPRWMHDLKAVRLATPGPVGVGTEAEGTVRILGLAVIDPITITEYEPPARFAIAHRGAFRGTGRITLQPGADGTTTIVRWEETLVPPLLPEVGALALRPVLREVFQADLHRLRALVEAG